LDPRLEILEEIDITPAGNIDSWLVACREFQDLLDRANGLLAPVIALAPRAISCHPGQPATSTLRFRGLPCAYWENGTLFLTLEDSRKPITGDARPVLAPRLCEMELQRNLLASATRQPLYHAQPERWLEALLREDGTRIDPKFVYTQVFAVSAGAHGILDILCATRSGRLAILELKASENIKLPLQAAEGWLRMQRHLQQGDFPRYGHFPGVELQKAPPLVYLVAPARRFHPTTDISWRRGLCVVQRQ
jgi:hypothetical protein